MSSTAPSSSSRLRHQPPVSLSPSITHSPVAVCTPRPCRSLPPARPPTFDRRRWLPLSLYIPVLSIFSLEFSLMAIVESASAAPIESVAADPALVEAPATDDVPPAVKTAKAKAMKAPKEKKTVTKKLLLVQLRKLTAAGKLTKVKNSYKIPAKPVVGGKKTAVSAKLKPKSAAVKPKTAAKSKSVAPKPKASSGLAKAAKNSVKATPAKLKMAAPVVAKKLETVKKIPAVKKAEKWSCIVVLWSCIAKLTAMLS